MKAALEALLAMSIEEFYLQPNAHQIMHDLKKKYGSDIEENSLALCQVIPSLLLLDIAGSEALMNQLMRIINSISEISKKNKRSELTNNLIEILPYIRFKFLIEYLGSVINQKFDLPETSVKNFAEEQMLEIHKIEAFITDELLSFQVCHKILSVASNIKNFDDFRKCQNLISFICSLHQKGDQILVYLIDQILLRHPANYDFLKEIIDNLQLPIQIKDAENTLFRPIREECQEVLRQKQKEIEFARIKTADMSLVAIIKIFNLYGNCEGYRMAQLYYHNIYKALEYLNKQISGNFGDHFSEIELYLLVEKLRSREIFLSFFVKYNSKAKLDLFCLFIKNQEDLDGKDDVVIAIQGHEYQKSKTQKDRLQIITGAKDEHLGKIEEEFLATADIINKTQITDLSEALFFSLRLLSNQIFQTLDQKKQLEGIKSFVYCLEESQIESEDINVASVYCLVKCAFILMNFIAENTLGDKERLREIIRDTLNEIAKRQSILRYLIENDELPNLKQDIEIIYREFARQIKDPEEVQYFAEQILFIDIAGLDKAGGFEFLIKELLLQNQHQLPKLIKIFEAFIEFRSTLITEKIRYDFVLEAPRKKLLNKAIQEIEFQVPLNIANAIGFFRKLEKLKEESSLEVPIDGILDKIKDFLRTVKFEDQLFVLIIKEMEKDSKFSRFFIEQQSGERIAQLVPFIRNKFKDNSQKEAFLVGKILTIYHGDEVIEEDVSGWLNQSLPALKLDDPKQQVLQLQSIMSQQMRAVAERRDEISQIFAKKDQELEVIKSELAASKLMAEEQAKILLEKEKELKKYQLNVKQDEKTSQNLQLAIVKLKKEIDDAKISYRELQSKNLDLERQIRAFGSRTEEVIKALKREQQEHSKTKDLLAKNSNEVRQKQQEIARLKDEIEEVKIKYQALKSENPKLTKQIEALTRQISALQIKLEEASEELRRELQKHPQIEVLSVANISDKLRQKEQEILAIVQDRFGGVTEILRDNLLQQAIAFKRLDITGSQVYVPLLRMLDDKDILFKDDGQPHDLDLCLVFSDDDFSQKLSQKNIEQFVSMLLPGFEIIKVNTAYPPKMSTSIKLRFKDQEIDLNIYGENYYRNLSGWQFNADRMRLCYDLKDNNWQFAINNNQATSQNQFADCKEFLLALKAGEVDLLQANQYASGFLNRMLKDCGRIKLTPSALAGVQDKLLSEMSIILQQDYQLGVNYGDWGNFRQNHCQELVKNSRKDELVIIKNIHQICILRNAVKQSVIIQLPPKQSPTVRSDVTLPVVSLQQLSVIK